MDSFPTARNSEAEGLGEEARHKKSPFLRCFRPERLKKGDFLCRLLRGCRALAGKPLRAQGSGLRGRGPAQKVTFFEVFQAGQAQKR